VLTLPKVWVQDLGLGPGDRLDVYRDVEDRLIIQAARPEQKEELPLGAGQGARR
jgi:bifunctional DNA-binding transcriptional regulator/antitoxin component of YhaV-PrlF toxin-antitoxin module